MKSGASAPLRTSPPSNKANSEAAIKKLQLLSEWSEEPAQEAAQSVGARAEVSNTLKIEPEPVKAAPWNNVALADNGTKSVNFKLPLTLYQKLKWLGETTYGSSMTQILVDEMTKATDRLLKERGAQPTRQKK